MRTLQPYPVTYICGLDLGQAQDYTALAIAAKSWKPHPDDDDRLEAHYFVGDLRRWPLKTPYPEIIDDLGRLVARPPLDYPSLGVDQTGVGKAIVDLLRSKQLAASLRPILITAGHQTIRGGDGAWHVPKKELVSCVQALLQTRRLQVAAVPERDTLVKELLDFKVKITAAANETYESWRERDHDDLVFAVAMACWLGERGGAPVGEIPTVSTPYVRYWERGRSRAREKGLFGLEPNDREHALWG
jgi:hypothetical protein